ncbi:hypothetical protein C8P63_11329 [Melghirimyces profundicolus]|uniref:Cyclodeaminase/cyclohydrolase domain-containing protein n=1 Tax=Melghirimyces profundicolus TaxID=1242148 RepID=A0A2T6BSQ0_9BACL|nr:hypothetical protein [Melghirimyces profundicolus]PTX59084.1 hypothetical protein C8P63_11329 [Melghirimyces profundicolus]
MSRFAFHSLSGFCERMAERKIPSPAAGSSLAASVMMACSLLELTVSSLAEKGESVGERNPASDWRRIREWRKEAEFLVDEDIRIVGEMIREKEQVKPKEWLKPIRRLHDMAVEILDLIPVYLPVSGNKASDTVVSCLHLRTAMAGSYHIACSNARAFGWECPFPANGEAALERADRLVREALRTVKGAPFS